MRLPVAVAMALLNGRPMGTSTLAVDEKLIMAAMSRVSSKLLMKCVTAPGRYFPPKVVAETGFIDPERSKTTDKINWARVACALADTVSVFHAGRMRIKKVLILVVAVTVRSVLTPFAALLTTMVGVTGPTSRRGAP